MTLYAIADLHLSQGVDKPMAVFGPQWRDHQEKIEANWQTIQDQDTVVIPGDISWAMTFEELLPDFAFLDRLPGQKILIQGNHDYWWTTVTKMNRFCQEQGFSSLTFLRNQAVPACGDWIVCGSRGWLLPGDPGFEADDEKVFRREVDRLERSLLEADRIRQSHHKLLVAMHYPPFAPTGRRTPFTCLMADHRVDCCVYGHIHGVLPGQTLAGPKGDTRYQLVASDHLSFRPWPVNSHG